MIKNHLSLNYENYCFETIHSIYIKSFYERYLFDSKLNQRNTIVSDEVIQNISDMIKHQIPIQKSELNMLSVIILSAQYNAVTQYLLRESNILRYLELTYPLENSMNIICSLLHKIPLLYGHEKVTFNQQIIRIIEKSSDKLLKEKYMINGSMIQFMDLIMSDSNFDAEFFNTLHTCCPGFIHMLLQYLITSSTIKLEFFQRIPEKYLYITHSMLIQASNNEAIDPQFLKYLVKISTRD